MKILQRPVPRDEVSNPQFGKELSPRSQQAENATDEEGSGRIGTRLLNFKFLIGEMSAESEVKQWCDESDARELQNNSTNTLKSVRKKIRNFTIRRRGNENSKGELIEEQKEMNVERNGDESLGKSKITLKKIFRKSSFKKIFNNIQNFTNFTVSGLKGPALHSFKIRQKKKKASCLS